MNPSTLKDFFSFSRKDRNGIILLCGIIVSLLFAPLFYPLLFSSDISSDFSNFSNDIEQYQNALLAKQQADQEKAFLAKKHRNKETYPNESKPLTAFNPNQLNYEKAVALGLSPKVAHTIENFLEKNGHFYKKEDLKKIYGLTATDYQRLSPYIQLENSNNPNSQQATKKRKGQSNAAPVQSKLFAFNPNTVSHEQLLQLGLSEKTATTFGKFRNSGAKFYKKEDLKKVYGISDEDYQRLVPYIDIPTADATNEQPTNESKVEKNTDEKRYDMTFASSNNNSSYTPAPNSININTATVEKLKTLKGIGNVFANRIVKYRNLLGGYTKVSQLKEVYGMESELYNAITPYLVNDIALNNIQKINVNTASISDLKKHPYIEYTIAKSIVAIREQHGNYTAVDDIKKSYHINEKLYQKLAPYLTVEPAK